MILTTLISAFLDAQGRELNGRRCQSAIDKLAVGYLALNLGVNASPRVFIISAERLWGNVDGADQWCECLTFLLSKSSKIDRLFMGIECQKLLKCISTRLKGRPLFLKVSGVICIKYTCHVLMGELPTQAMEDGKRPGGSVCCTVRTRGDQSARGTWGRCCADE